VVLQVVTAHLVVTVAAVAVVGHPVLAETQFHRLPVLPVLVLRVA
jgi:hypothetical protein